MVVRPLAEGHIGPDRAGEIAFRKVLQPLGNMVLKGSARVDLMA
jgi:hypothetical protein